MPCHVYKLSSYLISASICLVTHCNEGVPVPRLQWISVCDLLTNVVSVITSCRAMANHMFYAYLMHYPSSHSIVIPKSTLLPNRKLNNGLQISILMGTIKQCTVIVAHHLLPQDFESWTASCTKMLVGPRQWKRGSKALHKILWPFPASSCMWRKTFSPQRKGLTYTWDELNGIASCSRMTLIPWTSKPHIWCLWIILLTWCQGIGWWIWWCKWAQIQLDAYWPTIVALLDTDWRKPSPLSPHSQSDLSVKTNIPPVALHWHQWNVPCNSSAATHATRYLVDDAHCITQAKAS